MMIKALFQMPHCMGWLSHLQLCLSAAMQSSYSELIQPGARCLALLHLLSASCTG